MPQNPKLRCTQLCHHAVAQERCPRRDCWYAHDLQHLRAPPSNYSIEGDYPVPGRPLTKNFRAMVRNYQNLDWKLPSYARMAIEETRAGQKVAPMTRPHQTRCRSRTPLMRKRSLRTAAQHTSLGAQEPERQVPRVPTPPSHPPPPELLLQRTKPTQLPLHKRSDVAPGAISNVTIGQALSKLGSLEVRLARLMDKELYSGLLEAIQSTSISRRVSRLNDLAQPYMEVWIDSYRNGQFDGKGAGLAAAYDGTNAIQRIDLLEQMLIYWEALVPTERPVHAMR